MHCVGPLGVGTLLVKPKRHLICVSELTDAESRELGPLLRQLAAVIDDLLSPEQVYVCLWSRVNGRPGHIHHVVQPATRELMERHDAYGANLQVAMFELGQPPPVDTVDSFAHQARAAFRGN